MQSEKINLFMRCHLGLLGNPGTYFSSTPAAIYHITSHPTVPLLTFVMEWLGVSLRLWAAKSDTSLVVW